VSHIIHLRRILPVDDDLTAAAAGDAIDYPVAVARRGVDELQVVSPTQPLRQRQPQGAAARRTAG
jgi:hypothetical protein